MMHIERAIRDAYAAGWANNKAPYMHEFVGANMYWSQWKDANGTPYTLSVSDHFMDPWFWQALAKARHWSLAAEPTWEGKSAMIEGWLYEWLRFIRHVATGDDAESFFATLV